MIDKDDGYDAFRMYYDMAARNTGLMPIFRPDQIKFINEMLRLEADDLY